jgi:hypothetical protein
MADKNDSNARLAAHPAEPIPDWHLTLDRIRLRPDIFSDESLAPLVEHDLLLAHARRQLNQADAGLTQRLIVCFKSWQDAYNEILIAELRAANDESR